MSEASQPASSPASPPAVAAAEREGLAAWLDATGVDLVVAARAANRLLHLRAGGTGLLETAAVPWAGPRALAAAGGELWVATEHQIWRLQPVAHGQAAGSRDHTYVPRAALAVGAVGLCDVQPTAAGPVVVCALYSCVAVAGGDGLRVVWQPPWISALAPDDRSRVSGVAVADGEPHYATAFSRSDVPGGWRQGWLGGGVVVRVADGEIVGGGLTLPRCPRLGPDGRLWLLDGGSGALGTVVDGAFVPRVDLPGFPGALLVVGEHAVVGVSALRGGAPPLPLARRLAATGEVARCGVAVVHLPTARRVAWVETPEAGGELDALALVPADATVAAPRGEAARRLVSFRAVGELPTVHWLAGLEPLAAPDALLPPGLPAAPAGAKPARRAASYAFHPVPDATLGRLVSDYEGLGFPDLERRHAVRPLREPLLAVAALVAGAPVGLAVAEARHERSVAELASLRVHPDHRRRGVGAELLHRLEEEARRAGLGAIQGLYRTGWKSRAAVERLIAAAGWAPPRPSLHLFRIGRERSAADALPQPPPLPAGCELFPWAELRDEERAAILERQAAEPWYPDVLTPFQAAPRLEPRVSLGLRCAGEVAGWLVAHRVADDTLQYSALFVRPDLQRLGVGLTLMAEARRRRMATAYAFSIFAVEARNQRMLELVQKRLAPLVLAADELRVSGKPLP